MCVVCETPEWNEKLGISKALMLQRAVEISKCLVLHDIITFCKSSLLVVLIIFFKSGGPGLGGL